VKGKSMTDITPEAVRSMSIAERILLVEKISDDIAEDAAALQLSEAQKQELDRRIAAIEADPNRGSSWEDVKARLRQRR
jgi:putative addiction module component (TIGR02574 family)